MPAGKGQYEGEMTHFVATDRPTDLSHFHHTLNTKLLEIARIEGKLGKRWHAASLH